MQKHVINVSKEIKYLSEIKNFELPNGILNKQVTGCGATTIALTDQHPTIICSPRNELIINKHDQYPESMLVIGGVKKEDIQEYLSTTKTPKILISFDSMSKILDSIQDFSKWRIVVDEFHYILSDASFKSEVGLKFLNQLASFPYVTYLSATPMLDEYIETFEILQNVPYYQMKWQNRERIEVKREITDHPSKAAGKVIENYKRKNFPVLLLENKVEVLSTECVMFFNSVNEIVKLIKTHKIPADNVNIICGNSPENVKKISSLGKEYFRGRIPGKQEVNKMFTFCTSTSYAGCDFYSDVASTFIISDCRNKNTSVDIQTDLVQIAGRQRNESNPFRAHITLIYNIDGRSYLPEQFEEYIQNKVSTTNDEIADLNNIISQNLRKIRIQQIKQFQIINKYSDTYTMYDEVSDCFIFNKLAKMNEEYSYKVKNYNYSNGIIVNRLLDEAGFTTKGNEDWNLYYKQIKMMISKEIFEEQMKKYCDVLSSKVFGYNIIAKSISNNNPEIESYYQILGPEFIKSKSFKESNLKNEVMKRRNLMHCYRLIKKKITVGAFISSLNARQIIQGAYDTLKIQDKSSGAILKQWYHVEDTVQRIDGKLVRGYKIIGKIDENQ